MTKKLTFIVPGDPDQRTGGYLYDARIVSELRAGGWEINQFGLEGRFPIPDSLARNSMARVLETLEDGELVVIDGLALGGLSKSAATHAQRLRLIALVHHPLADETGLAANECRQLLALEGEALGYCRQVIVTSLFTARRLQKLGLTTKPALVIEPGVDRADAAPAAVARSNSRSEPEHENLLCVASLTRRKGQDVLLTALAGLRRGRWSCRLSGSDQRDPVFSRALREIIRNMKLEDQVQITGERDLARLNEDYHWASVLVFPSHYEGYGMVVTEALARGLPLISTTGGALADTVPPDASLQVPPGDSTALAEALNRWLSNSSLRQRLSRAAMEHRRRLPRWDQAGDRFDAALRSTRDIVS